MSDGKSCTVVIGSFLEAELVEGIAAPTLDLRVLYRPELLPGAAVRLRPRWSPRCIGP